jgi:hypothetical protein
LVCACGAAVAENWRKRHCDDAEDNEGMEESEDEEEEVDVR